MREPVILAPLILPLRSISNVPVLFLNVPPVIEPPVRSPVLTEIEDKLLTCIFLAFTLSACIILFVMILSSNNAWPVTCNSLPSILVPAGVRLMRLTISRPSRLLIACVTFNSIPLDI